MVRPVRRLPQSMPVMKTGAARCWTCGARRVRRLRFRMRPSATPRRSSSRAPQSGTAPTQQQAVAPSAESPTAGKSAPAVTIVEKKPAATVGAATASDAAVTGVCSSHAETVADAGDAGCADVGVTCAAYGQSTRVALRTCLARPVELLLRPKFRSVVEVVGGSRFHRRMDRILIDEVNARRFGL